MTEKRKNRGEIIQSIIFLVLVNIDISFQLKFEVLQCTLKIDEGRRTKQHIRPKEIDMRNYRIMIRNCEVNVQLEKIFYRKIVTSSQ